MWERNIVREERGRDYLKKNKVKYFIPLPLAERKTIIFMRTHSFTILLSLENIIKKKYTSEEIFWM